jgi:hypothetical protein
LYIVYRRKSESRRANYLYSLDSVASGFCRFLFVIHLAYSLIYLLAYPFHRLIPFIPTELKTIKQYIINNLDKGFIKTNWALYAASVLFIKKLNKSI